MRSFAVTRLDKKAAQRDRLPESGRAPKVGTMPIGAGETELADDLLEIARRLAGEQKSLEEIVEILALAAAGRAHEQSR